MKKKFKIFSYQGQILFDMLLVAVLSILTMNLPFAQYVYKKKKYMLTGFSFFSEHKIQKGTVIVPSTKIVVALLIVIILSAMVAIVFPKIKKIRISGYLLALTGIFQFGISIFFKIQLEYILTDVKKYNLGYGVWIEAVLGLLIIARAMQILYKNKVLSALDFMVMPGCIYLLINNYFPMLGIFIAFKDIDYSVGIFNSKWVGLTNFKYLFASSDAWVMTRNTILYNIVFIVLGNIFAIVIGIMLNELFSKKLQKLYQTLILLPQLISIIIVSYIVFAFLSNEAGLITKRLMADSGINFYNSPGYWPFILVFIYLWKGVGYSSIIYLSSIVGIDRTLYEAAYVDGANKFQQIFKIT